MHMASHDLDAAYAATLFSLDAPPLSVEPYGNGHINETFLVTTAAGRAILQRMNTGVFPDPAALMRNIGLVTAFLRARGAETLDIVPGAGGAPYIHARDGYWRMYRFIEGTVSYELVPDASVFEAAGGAFGRFQRDLADFDASQLAVTIPDFHTTTKRYGALCGAIDRDAAGRLTGVEAEARFFQERAGDVGAIDRLVASGAIPMRVTHNDTKLNNILMDASTGAARAIIDLDTVMPGTMLADFGDAIRFGASTGLEDEPDLGKVHFSLPLFAAFAHGFLSPLKDVVTDAEASMLAQAARLMTLECGMRFLADYLDGDRYFAVRYGEHNLVRARTQIRLAGEMELQMASMERIVAQELER